MAMRAAAAAACLIWITTSPGVAGGQRRGGMAWYGVDAPGPSRRVPGLRGDAPGRAYRRCPPPRDRSVIGAIAGGLLGGQPADGDAVLPAAGGALRNGGGDRGC